MAPRVANLFLLCGLAALAACGGSSGFAPPLPASENSPAPAATAESATSEVYNTAAASSGASDQIAVVNADAVAGEGEGVAPATDEPVVAAGDETIAPPP